LVFPSGFVFGKHQLTSGKIYSTVSHTTGCYLYIVTPQENLKRRDWPKHRHVMCVRNVISHPSEVWYNALYHTPVSSI